MTEGMRVDLTGELQGHHVLISPRAKTVRFQVALTKMQKDADFDQLITAIADVLVGGDLEHGHDQEGLLDLEVLEFGAVVDGLASVVLLPKQR